MMTEQKLVDLGFKPNCKGFYFLKDAVNMVLKNKFVKTGIIYSTIARTYGESNTRVERAIRHCIEASKTIYKKDCNSLVFSKLAILVKENA